MKPAGVHIRCTLQVTSEVSEPSNQCRSPYYCTYQFDSNVTLPSDKRYVLVTCR